MIKRQLDRIATKARDYQLAINKETTMPFPAHRLTTVEDCDKVIWLEKGRIKMIGKPEKVLKVYNQGEVIPQSPKNLNFNPKQSESI